MTEQQSCAALAIEAVSKGYSLLRSTEGQVLLTSLACVKALIVYCGKSPFLEARKLACTLFGALLLTGAIATVELKLPAAITLAMACKSSSHPVVVAGRDPRSTKPAFSPRDRTGS